MIGRSPFRRGYGREWRGFEEAGDFDVDDVEPNGCNVFDIQIHLGGER